MPVTLKAEDRSTATVLARIGVTVTPVASAWDKVPDTPVTVTEAVAGGVDLLVVSVMVLDSSVLAGLNAAATPAGRPDAERCTLPLKLPLGNTTILVAAVLPCGTETPSDDVVSVKSLRPASCEGSTSYSGRAGLTSGFSSANEIASMRIRLLFGNLMVFAAGGRSIAYPNRYE